MPESAEIQPEPYQSQIEKACEYVDRYPELAWMVAESTQATPERSVAAEGVTMGEQLFPQANKAALREFDRAYTALASLDWVRSGDYASLTACQPEDIQLSRETFAWLENHTAEILHSDAALGAMETFLAINDLGKIGSFVDAVQHLPGAPSTVDHDVVMHYGLTQCPDLSPSFASLDDHYAGLIMQGMGTGFNLGQLLRGENVPASLAGLHAADEEVRSFYLLHTLYDLAGAAGHMVQNGSMLLTEPIARNYKYAYESIKELATGKSVEAVYHDYLRNLGRGLEIWGPPGQGVPVSVRLAGMLSLTNAEQKNRLLEAYGALHPNTFAILEKELFEEGDGDRSFRESMGDTRGKVNSLVYYAPALLRNLQQGAGDNSETWKENMTLGLETLARVYQAGRTRSVMRQSAVGSVQTILIRDLADAAANNPEQLRRSRIILEGEGLDVEAKLLPANEINLQSFSRLENLATIPGKRIALVGMGGGSDGVQAAVLSKLFVQAGKECLAVISIRTAAPQSAGADGVTPPARHVQNHGGEIVGGAYKITPDTHGSGRFLEHLPAGDVPMFLVIDDLTTEVTERIQAVLETVGSIDTVIGIDTGGDVLFSSTGQETAAATPDQDLRSLQAIAALKGITKLCAVVAPGIDSPEDTEDILRQQAAVYFEPSAEQTTQILATYKGWHMDGTNGRYFGKTSLAWQAALRMGNPAGVVALNLPGPVVTSEVNPWDPYVMIQPAMRGVFIMPINE